MGKTLGFGGIPGSETCKKYIGASILTIFQIFKKSIFKNQVFRYFFDFLAYIFTYFGITIKRAMKKHASCLIFTLYGSNRGPNRPKQHLESSSAIISTLNPS